MAKKSAILIVDREKLLVELLVRILSSDELSAFGTTTVEEGQHLFDMHAPSLAVVDPSVSGGLTFLKLLRSQTSSTKLIALTSSNEMRLQVQESGIETILDKDLGMEALVDAIRKLLDADLPSLTGGNGIRILVTDDEAALRGLMSKFLKERGYGVVTAKNGIEAIEQIQSDPLIRLVLLDISMPGMGGIEALARIKSLSPHIGVIMMTAVEDREVARAALKAGAFDYMLKPYDFAVTESSIAACLSYLEFGKQPWWKRLRRH